MTETVQALVPMADYQQDRPQLFPSIDSMRWYVRMHRSKLIDSDALVMVNRRYLVSPSAFDAFAMKAGKEDALKAAA